MTESADLATNDAAAAPQRSDTHIGGGGIALALVPVFVGAIAGLVLDSYVLALVNGLFMRESVAWISRTSGEQRRLAIALNVILWSFFAAVLAVAYHARFFLNLIGIT